MSLAVETATLARAATLVELLARGAANAPALGAPDRAPLTYAALRCVVAGAGRVLHAAGLGRADRVAVVLPNGPEMAAAFLSVSAVAVAAPLNPGFGEEELRFALTDLRARALVVMFDETGPARAVAEALGVPIIELHPDPAAAGAFTLRPASGHVADADEASFPAPSDVALVLHTSGTTAKPKSVPLTHANLATSAANIGSSLALTEDDVCINIMPLFHIHGLVAAILASLGAGGSVVCCPGLNAFQFFRWFDVARPTWYTAVPTMHQTLLEIAPRRAETIARGRLRFIRSSSASLPAPVMARLEATFGVPVIEAYGMTEASHQMASNPLPPLLRFAGSVGVPAGPEVAIMDEAGRLMPPGLPGEIVIRGPNVTAGYDNNPDANAGAFTDGWFRTGDEGVLDTEGYLRLTGRLKEIINRAGEKISPVEIDAVLHKHPDVQQAVTFAIPSQVWGEEVGAVVVLREGVAPNEQAVRDFVAARVAAFKVPQRVLFLPEIPKSPTGKLQRIGLAARLGLGDAAKDA